MNWVIIGLGDGLSLVRRQGITWSSAGLLSIALLETYFSEICIGILSFSLKTNAIHYDDVIMTRMASQITSLAIVYSTVYSGADQSKHQSSASLAFVWEIHRGPVNFPHKWPVTRKMFPFDDVIMIDVCQNGNFVQGKMSYSLLASEVNPAMVSTVRFYDRNQLYGSPDVRNYRMPNSISWAFFVISLISIN